MSLLADFAGALTSPTGEPRAPRRATESHHAALDYPESRDTQLELTRRLSPWARQRLIGGPLRHA